MGELCDCVTVSLVSQDDDQNQSRENLSLATGSRPLILDQVREASQ